MGIFLFLDRTLDWEILSRTLAARVRLNIIQESREHHYAPHAADSGDTTASQTSAAAAGSLGRVF